MKKLWILLSLILAYSAFHYSKKGEVPPTPVNEVSTQTVSPVPVAPMVVKNVRLKAPITAAVIPADPSSRPNAPVDPRYSLKPTEPIVEFKVEDGHAVAFGDTILGDAPKGFTGSQGLTEIPQTRLWLRGEIPYHIQKDLIHPERVEAAIQMFHTRTGIKFVPYTGQPDAVVFSQGKQHCLSMLGRVGGLQPIYLEEDCDPIAIAHEVMHALGFVHEQSRTDRDQYVEILWPNIQPPYQSQYAMVPEGLMEVYGGSAFDPTSILMYDPHSFAIAPEAETMKMKNGAPIKRAPGGLSDADVERVNRLYGK